jgi:hypothetical protein
MVRRDSLHAVVLWAALAAACGGSAGLPPRTPPRVTGPDGKQYYLLDKGPYKAYYDAWGRLERFDYDSNADGRPDVIAHHRGAKLPSLLEVDADFDGTIDRWEDYDAAGRLVKVGTARHGRGPDNWTFPGPGEQPSRREYDNDGDGRIEKAEVYSAGRVARVELDGDGDGRVDRWQSWSGSHLDAEELDTDGDGRADRRLRYGARGRIEAVERVTK